MAVPDPANPISTPSPIVPGSQEFGFEADFADLAARFAAKSGGGLSAELSAELALEIVLNEIVEQACQITGATGAAIVLDRDGQLLCRASSGSTAPELGSRIDPSSGLAGECLRSPKTLWCDDTFTDSRAETDSSRQRGIRSVVIMPLLRGGTLVGIFELFSTEPYAFGVRDERTLEVLADRTLNNLDHASQPLDSQAEPAGAAADLQEEDLQKIGVQDVSFHKVPGNAPSTAGSSEIDSDPADICALGLNVAKNGTSDAKNNIETAPLPCDGVEFGSDFPDFDPADITPEQIHTLLENAGVIVPETEPVAKNLASAEKPQASEVIPTPLAQVLPRAPVADKPALTKHFDYVNWALGFAIVSVAVMLGLVLGQHFVLNHAQAPIRAAASPPPASTPTRPASGTAPLPNNSLARPASEKSDVTAKTSRPARISSPREAVANSDETVPPGGLVVSENGKEVFRLPPDSQQTPSAQQVVEPASDLQSDSAPQSVVNIPEALAQKELLHRVEPEYPEAAREQNMQGRVVLEVHISTSGSVEDVETVSGLPLLAQASMDAVKQWKFKPRVVNGRPVQMQTQVTFDFRLPQ